MKNWEKICVLCFASILFGSGKPYEYQIEMPAGIFINRNESEHSLVPHRRTVPEEYKTLFENAVVSTGIPPAVLESIASVESDFIPWATSPLGKDGRCDLGMFQFNSKYLEWYAAVYNAGATFDPMSPDDAIIVAAKHIRFLYDRYNHWPTVFIAYNAGMTAVDNNEIPDCSFRYLAKIYDEF